MSNLPTNMALDWPIQISPTERRVLEELMLDGALNKQIAERLGLRPNTIKAHMASILKKSRAESRAQLVAMAYQGAFGPKESKEKCE